MSERIGFMVEMRIKSYVALFEEFVVIRNQLLETTVEDHRLKMTRSLETKKLELAKIFQEIVEKMGGDSDTARSLLQERVSYLGNLQLLDEALPAAGQKERAALVDGALYDLLVQQIAYLVREHVGSFTIGDLPLEIVQKLEELLSMTGTQLFKDYPELTTKISEGIGRDISNWELQFSSGFAGTIPLVDIKRLHALLRIRNLIN